MAEAARSAAAARDVVSARNRALMGKRFAALSAGDSKPFWGGVADDVVWTVTGTVTGSGTFRSKREFREASVAPVRGRLTDLGVPGLVRDIIADGDMVVLEWERKATAASGMPYHHRVCWVMRLRDDVVVEATSYVDTKLVADLVASSD